MTLLLAEYTLSAHANLCYPTTRLHSYFSTIFAAHLLCIYTYDVREALGSTHGLYVQTHNFITYVLLEYINFLWADLIRVFFPEANLIEADLVKGQFVCVSLMPCNLLPL